MHITFFLVEHQDVYLVEDQQDSAAPSSTQVEIPDDKLSGKRETCDTGIQTDSQTEREVPRDSMAKIASQLQASQELLGLKEVCYWVILIVNTSKQATWPNWEHITCSIACIGKCIWLLSAVSRCQFPGLKQPLYDKVRFVLYQAMRPRPYSGNKRCLDRATIIIEEAKYWMNTIEYVER